MSSPIDYIPVSSAKTRIVTYRTGSSLKHVFTEKKADDGHDVEITGIPSNVDERTLRVIRGKDDSRVPMRIIVSRPLGGLFDGNLLRGRKATITSKKRGPYVDIDVLSLSSPARAVVLGKSTSDGSKTVLDLMDVDSVMASNLSEGEIHRLLGCQTVRFDNEKWLDTTLSYSTTGIAWSDAVDMTIVDSPASAFEATLVHRIAFKNNSGVPMVADTVTFVDGRQMPHFVRSMTPRLAMAMTKGFSESESSSSSPPPMPIGELEVVHVERNVSLENGQQLSFLVGSGPNRVHGTYVYFLDMSEWHESRDGVSYEASIENYDGYVSASTPFCVYRNDSTIIAIENPVEYHPRGNTSPLCVPLGRCTDITVESLDSTKVSDVEFYKTAIVKNHKRKEDVRVEFRVPTRGANRIEFFYGRTDDGDRRTKFTKEPKRVRSMFAYELVVAPQTTISVVARVFGEKAWF